MPSSRNRSRSRATTRRSPHAAPLRREQLDAPAGRPMLAPFVSVFAVLVAAEDGYLAWLLAASWYPAVPLVLAALALTGAVLVWQGRRPGVLVLSVASAITLLGLLVVAVVFAYLGGGSAFVTALLLLVGPAGALILGLQPAVRRWTRPGRATRIHRPLRNDTRTG